MVEKINLDLYSGTGIPITKRNLSLPEYSPVINIDDPKNYIADKGLKDAVNVAIALGQPLLVTGEPGTGKTQLAESVAHEFGLHAPLKFHTKTTSAAADLFYRYDALRRFHDSQVSNKEIKIEDYITYEALGIAILLSKSSNKTDQFLPEKLRNTGPTRSVVLIDEIDKAPRDLPNDILNEIEKMEFTVKETGRIFQSKKSFRPILILTSNSEKNLPDAFLRRCIFYHIPFPSQGQLHEIVKKRFEKTSIYNDNFESVLIDAIKHFIEIRELPLKKKPATAELLAWVQILNSLEVDMNNIEKGNLNKLSLSYSILAKTQEDLEMIQRRYNS